MEIIEKPPLYQKEHGDIKNYNEFFKKFPKGVTICNGKSYDSSKLGWQKFRGHIRRRGQKCKCPIFTEEDNGKDVLKEISELKISNGYLVRQLKEKDEKRILEERKRTRIQEKLNIIEERVENLKKYVEERKIKYNNSNRLLYKELNLVLKKI
jgi:hypothetical protein